MSALFLDHLADHFALHGLGQVGKTIYQDEFPASKDGLLLLDAGGRAGDRVFGSHFLKAQITSRSANPETAKTKIWAVWALVGNLRKVRVGGPSGTLIMEAVAVQQPFPFGRDESGLFRYAVNIEFTLGPHS